MADIDLDAILAQRAEARGDEGFTFSFKMHGQEWVAKDPMLLTDDEKDELSDLTYDVDVAAFFMGDDQYDDFVAAGGQSSHFVLALQEYQKARTDEAQGRPTRPNRSSRRQAERKQSKPRSKPSTPAKTS